MGAEHSIANQFLFSLAKFLGWQESVNSIIVKNLIPSTIGNIIGGAFFVATMYAFAIGTGFDQTYAMSRNLGRQIVQRYRPLATRLGFVGARNTTPCMDLTHKLSTTKSNSKSLHTSTNTYTAGVSECIVPTSEIPCGAHQQSDVLYTGFENGAVGSPKQDYIGIQVDGDHSMEQSRRSSDIAPHDNRCPSQHANSTDLCGPAARVVPTVWSRVREGTDGISSKAGGSSAGQQRTSQGGNAQAVTLQALQQQINAMGATQETLLQQLQSKVDALTSATKDISAHPPPPCLQSNGNATPAGAENTRCDTQGLIHKV